MFADIVELKLDIKKLNKGYYGIHISSSKEYIFDQFKLIEDQNDIKKFNQYLKSYISEKELEIIVFSSKYYPSNQLILILLIKSNYRNTLCHSPLVK